MIIINIPQLYNNILVSNFPYFSKKEQKIYWENNKYRNGNTILWHLYFRDLQELIKIINSSYELGLIQHDIRRLYITKISIHRTKFIKRLYYLGILNKECYDYLSQFNGWISPNLESLITNKIIKSFNYKLINNINTLAPQI